jgi:hypothetical protein
MSDVPPAQPGISHILNGNKNKVGQGRVDKLETDHFNSIVERITGGLNPSKLAAEVTGAPVDTGPPPPAAARVAGRVAPAAGPGPRLGSQLPWGGEPSGDPTVVQLSKQVAMLEQRLAKYEVFNGNDNDVVVTSTRKPKGPSNRGPESSVFARDIDPKKAKTKDPVDGKPDGPNNKDAQMAGEHVNILGISMTEWRSMAGLKEPAVDLTARQPIQESYEDEVDGEEQRPDQASVVEHQLWTDFLRLYDTTPEQFAHFVEAADNAQDAETLVAVQELEDEFVEAVECYLEGDAAAKETLDQFVKRGGVVQKLKAGKARGAAPLSKYLRAKGGPAQKQGHELPANVKKEDEDLGALWSAWLEDRGLSVETFDSLVEAAETEDDLATLEALQDMFEAEIAGKRIAGSSPTPSGDSELHQPGKAPMKMQSLAHGQVKPAGKAPGLPKYMRKKMGLPIDDSVEEDDAFECDDDGNGHPDMKHPGWAKAMSKFKLKKKDK